MVYWLGTCFFCRFSHCGRTACGWRWNRHGSCRSFLARQILAFSGRNRHLELEDFKNPRELELEEFENARELDFEDFKNARELDLAQLQKDCGLLEENLEKEAGGRIRRRRTSTIG